jgi:hypothetical protein
MLTPLAIYNVDALISSGAAQDRRAIVAYLREYLRTGDVVEPPRLQVAYKQIRLDRGREPLGQVSWKWSELTGKYAGCQFWTSEALRVASGFVSQMNGGSLKKSLEEASRLRHDESIQHEHVFPREAWIARMTPLVGRGEPPSESELEALLDRLCIGCVVTRAEHSEVDRRMGIFENPWLRYGSSSIRLVPNPAWTEPHVSWIRAAGLLEPR